MHFELIDLNWEEDRDLLYTTFYDVLNDLREQPNIDVYVTGSNSKFLSKDINDEFKDRGSEINIRPLSFSEYYPYFIGDKRFALQTYLKYGGMPGLFEEKTDAAKEKYLYFDDLNMLAIFDQEGLATIQIGMWDDEDEDENN